MPCPVPVLSSESTLRRRYWFQRFGHSRFRSEKPTDYRRDAGGYVAHKWHKLGTSDPFNLFCDAGPYDFYRESLRAAFLLALLTSMPVHVNLTPE